MTDVQRYLKRCGGAIAALVMFFALLSRSALAAPPPDLAPPEEPSGAGGFVTWAQQILDWYPIVAGAVCLTIAVGLHLWFTHRVSRGWRGTQPGWSQFWLVPCVVGVLVYAVLCGGLVIWGFNASPEFQNYFATQFSTTRKLLWLVGGWAIALLPPFALLFLGGKSPAHATEH